MGESSYLLLRQHARMLTRLCGDPFTKYINIRSLCCTLEVKNNVECQLCFKDRYKIGSQTQLSILFQKGQTSFGGFP